MVVHGLFAHPIAMFERSVEDYEKTILLNLKTKQNTGNLTSIDNFILQRTELTELRAWVEDCISEYFKATVNPKNDVTLRITQSWINYSNQGQYHHKHAHPNSLVSGVYYIQTNPDDKIYFYRAGFQQLKFTPAKWNEWNSDSWWFEAVEGKLILFPSNLEHTVPAVTGDKTRVSLSFNTFPIGSVGEELDLTGLKLGV